MFRGKDCTCWEEPIIFEQRLAMCDVVYALKFFRSSSVLNDYVSFNSLGMCMFTVRF